MSFPAVFNYVVSKQRYLPIARSDTAWDSVYRIGMKAIATKCYVIRWEMTDVPAFKEEPYIPAPDNYVSAIRFQLSEYPDLEKKK
jgi:hypothetical protein